MTRRRAGALVLLGTLLFPAASCRMEEGPAGVASGGAGRGEAGPEASGEARQEKPPPGAELPPVLTPEGRQAQERFLFADLKNRADRRAFYTAPPVIPHAVGQSDAECLGCHATVRVVDGHVTSLTPHPHFANCQQCHVRGAGPGFLRVKGRVRTDWRGLRPPGAGTRANPVAPPTIPHRLFGRERCASCHSPHHPYPHLRSAHPERAQCLQCHVLMRPELDF